MIQYFQTAPISRGTSVMDNGAVICDRAAFISIMFHHLNYFASLFIPALHHTFVGFSLSVTQRTLLASHGLLGQIIPFLKPSTL